MPEPVKPPPLPTNPPVPVEYRTPQKGAELGSLGQSQAIFDTVAGPNLRLRDNLIQLGAAGVGAILGIVTAFFITANAEVAIAVGGLGGAIGGVFISGAVLGIYRLVKGIKRKK